MFKFKDIKKKLNNSTILHYILARVISISFYLYLTLVTKTSRVSVVLPDGYKNFKDKKYIFCFWHGRLVSPLLGVKYGNKSAVLLSKGKDADIICLLMKLCGVDVVRGSTDTNNDDKGGTTSLKIMVELLRKNIKSIAIAPDGPVGPRMRAGVGTAVLSILGKTEVVPISMSAKPSIVAKSWDKNLILLPFSKIKVQFGAPISPFLSTGNKKDVESYRLEIETVLNNITTNLDKEMGLPLITPADLDRRGNPVKRKIINNDDSL